MPLGLYTSDGQTSDLRRYHRPLFSVTSSSSLTFDVTRLGTLTCDIQLAGDSGAPATAEEEKAAGKKSGIREELFPLPAKDGAPFQPYIR